MPLFKTGKRDFIVIGLLLLSALLFWFVYGYYNKPPEKGGVYAEVFYDGVLIDKAYLDEERKFSYDELPNVTFEVKDNKIAFVESDCPDQVCVHTGWLETDGHFAACLPNRIMLWIVDEDRQKSESSVETDALAR